jgi:hypothetical protein
MRAYRRGLSDTGYVEGRNITIEHRWANGQNERLPSMAADLVQRRVNVIVTGGSRRGRIDEQGGNVGSRRPQRSCAAQADRRQHRIERDPVRAREGLVISTETIKHKETNAMTRYARDSAVKTEVARFKGHHYTAEREGDELVRRSELPVASMQRTGRSGTSRVSSTV